MSRKMKDSGIEWIGEMPEAWKLVFVKYLFVIGRGRVIAVTELEDDGKYPVYSSQTLNDGCFGYLNTFDFEKSQLTWTTDGANAGTVFFREGRHNCTNVCGTLQPKTNDNLKYLKFCLEYIAFYHKRQDTNGFKIMNNEMANIKLVLPTINEQTYIANYLDTHCTLIDQTIEKQRQVIEKLKEYKQSVITEAVTKGLNPNMPMKDSGIEWIGEIPESWEVFPIKYILKNKSVKNYPDEQVLSLYRDYGVVPKNSRDDNHNVTSEDTSSYKLVDVGDFVINKMKAWQGSMAISDFRGIISPAYYICEFVRNDINRKYFHFLMRNQLYLPEFRRLSTGMRIGQWDLSFDNFKLIPYIVPKKNEQDEIVEYLEGKCFEIDNAIQVKEKIIEKLESYKKSLIYECVTGKREVK